jgi:hypothetical protein
MELRELREAHTAAEHIGDGVYASRDDCGLWLSASDGCRVTEEICLDPDVFAALVAYAQRAGWTP